MSTDPKRREALGFQQQQISLMWYNFEVYALSDDLVVDAEANTEEEKTASENGKRNLIKIRFLRPLFQFVPFQNTHCWLKCKNCILLFPKWWEVVVDENDGCFDDVATADGRLIQNFMQDILAGELAMQNSSHT